MKKKEAEFTRKVKDFLIESFGTGAYEIKHTRGKNTFYMRELQEHQIYSLWAVHKGGFGYKIPDDGRAYKPFDLLVLKKEKSFVVIAYPKVFVVINVLEMMAYKKPSLPIKKAMEIAVFTGLLRDL